MCSQTGDKKGLTLELISEQSNIYFVRFSFIIVTLSPCLKKPGYFSSHQPTAQETYRNFFLNVYKTQPMQIDTEKSSVAQ